MAEEMERYARESLRHIPPTPPSCNWMDREATRPVSPNLSFTEATPSPLPKSRDEIEDEKMSYFESHPFKARPVSQSVLLSRGDQGVPKKLSPKNKIVAAFFFCFLFLIEGDRRCVEQVFVTKQGYHLIVTMINNNNNNNINKNNNKLVFKYNIN